VIVDECHHISAFTFEQVMRQLQAKYVVGLTATPTRKDGHHPIIYMQCGPVQFSLSARTMTETAPFEHKVTPRPTEFRMAPELTEITIQDIYAALVDDASRNEMIANDTVRAIESGRCPLLLTGRTVKPFVHCSIMSTICGQHQNQDTAPRQRNGHSVRVTLLLFEQRVQIGGKATAFPLCQNCV